MGLNVGNLPVKQVYVGSTPVAAVYVGAEKVWPTSEVHEVSLIDVRGGGGGTIHPLLTVTVPAGETWQVRIQGTMTKSISSSTYQPLFRIGAADSGPYGPGAAVDFSGVVTSTSSTIAMVTRSQGQNVSFVGTVTIEKSAPSSNPTEPRVVTISTTRNEWNVGSQSGDVSMIQALTGPSRLVFSAPVTCDDAINAGSAGTFAAGNRLEAGWVLAPVAFRDQLYTFTEIL